MPTTTGIATEFINFTRASNATVTDSDGKIKWAPHNLLLASEQFDASSWTKSNATVTANTVAAPNGTTTAELVSPSAIGNARGVYQGVVVVTGGDYTVRVYAKPAGFDWLCIYDPSASGTGAAWFNVTTGALGTVAAGFTATAPVSVGNGWYLCSVTKTGFAAGTFYGFFGGVPSDNTVAVPGAGNGVYLWGAHVYRSDLGGMQANTSAYPMYNPTTPKNLLGYTEDFSNAAWTKLRCSVSANVAVAPNGLTTADALIEDTTASNTHSVLAGTTIVVGGRYTFSTYIKANTRTFVRVLVGDTSGSNAAYVDVNLLTGATSSGVTGTGWTVASATATISADGWCRVSITGAGAAATSGIVIVYMATALGTIAYTGDGTSGIYLWGAQLSDSASLDTYSPVYGAAVTSAAYYGPRRDFDPVTLACKGLLVEEQRTNLLLYSAQFDNAAWSKSAGATISANASTSPDGTSNADKLVFGSGAAAGTAYLYYVVSGLTNAISYTQSVFIKEAGVTTANIWSNISGAYKSVRINLSTGALSQNGGQALPTAYSVVNVGSGWWRVIISETTSGTSGNVMYVDTSVTGDGTNGVLLWGAQLEAGSFSTSYIPVGSTTAGATRNGDVAQVATAAFPYSSTAGSFVLSFLAGTANGLIGDGSAASTILYSFGQQARSYNGSTMLSAGNNWTSSAVSKAGVAFDASGRSLVVNAGTAATDALAFQSVTRLDIGYTGLTGGYLNGHIRQITYIPRRLSNAELQTRTS